MISDATSSPAPFSPFSTHSVISDTSDVPDLGAFASVFRALSVLHPASSPRSSAATAVQHHSSESSDFSRSSPHPISIPRANHHYHNHATLSEEDDDDNDRNDVDDLDDQGPSASSGTEFQITSDGEPPTLGMLDEAFRFLAEERSRLSNSRVLAVKTTESGSEGNPKKRRKRKRAVRAVPVTGKLTGDDGLQTSATTAGYGSSSPERQPALPAGVKVKATTNRLRLNNEVSSTSASPSPATPTDPRVLQLRSLNTKLRQQFPDFVDYTSPNAPPPTPAKPDSLVHVFIDHSNILIGFLNHLRKHPNPNTQRQKGRHISHAALVHILERGRPISRRVVVASSPLYQPMESAEQLGYEVRIYARVPDTGDGQDRTSKRLSGSAQSKKNGHHAKSPSFSATVESSATSTGSEMDLASKALIFGSSSFPRAGNAFPPVLARNFSSVTVVPTTSSIPASATVTPRSPNTSTAIANTAPLSASGALGRVKFREQGVDELLQLKLHQAIAAVDKLPPNATIVLATGDGNISQFDEEGFIGPVRTALKKGWKVELYAWEEGMSKIWNREFAQGPFKHQFRVIYLEQFGADLLELEV